MEMVGSKMGWMIKRWLFIYKPSNSSNKPRPSVAWNKKQINKFYWCFISVNRIHNFIDH